VADWKFTCLDPHVALDPKKRSWPMSNQNSRRWILGRQIIQSPWRSFSFSLHRNLSTVGQRRETGRRNFWIAHASNGVLKETVHTVHKGKSVEPWGLQTLESCPSSCARPRLVETSLRMARHWYIGRWRYIRYKLVQIITVKMCQIVEVAGRFRCMVEAMRSFGQLSKACWSFSMQKGSKGAAGNSGETHQELDVKAL